MERKAKTDVKMIKAPMKAPSASLTDEQLELLPYDQGVVGSPKHDGFRCVCGHSPLTSSMSPFKNHYINKVLSKPEYFGLDAEMIVGLPYSKGPEDDVYNRTTGPLRRHNFEPNFKIYVFDNWAVDGPYVKRWLNNYDKYKGLPFVEIMEQKPMSCPQDVIDYTQWCIDHGYEGAMIRMAAGPYKAGRCTLRELNIFKRKPLEDAEGKIIGFEPEMENLNPQKLTATGHLKRSHNKENLRPKDTLGRFYIEPLKHPEWGNFHLGTGKMTKERAKYIWDHRDQFIGKIVVFKYQAIGSIDAPRQLIFKGFRDIEDLTEF